MYLSVFCISSFVSPIDSPPMAYPSKSISVSSWVLFSRSFGFVPPCIIANSCCSFLGLWAFFDRSAHLVVRLVASITSSGVALCGGQWSSTIATSLPRSSCIFMHSSGVYVCFSPFFGSVYSIPFSVILNLKSFLIIWKPPLSVNIFSFQFMKLWSPPASLIASSAVM